MLSRNAVKQAGKNLKEGIESRQDLSIIFEFRKNHIHIMNTLTKTLRKKTPKPTLFSRRLKRLSSIKFKLNRNPGLQLSTMQDIGGLRAVFKTKEEVKKYISSVEEAYKSKRSVLEIINRNDYISEPKKDGYRSYHIIFRYLDKRHSDNERNGYKVELQLRTLLQHYWATAVEIMGVIDSNNDIKKGIGEEPIRRFFYLASLILDNSANKEEIKEFKELNNIYGLLDKLSKISASCNTIEKVKNKKDKFFIISLSYQDKKTKIIPIQEDDRQAEAMFKGLEEEDNMDTVIVSSDSVVSLKHAYPNYFLNAKKFIEEIEERVN